MRTLRHGRAQQVARRQVAQAVLLLNDGRLPKGGHARCCWDALRCAPGGRLQRRCTPGGGGRREVDGGGRHLRALAAAGRADEDDVLAGRHLHPTLELGQQVQRVHTLPRRRVELAHTSAGPQARWALVHQPSPACSDGRGRACEARPQGHTRPTGCGAALQARGGWAHLQSLSSRHVGETGAGDCHTPSALRRRERARALRDRRHGRGCACGRRPVRGLSQGWLCDSGCACRALHRPSDRSGGGSYKIR